MWHSVANGGSGIEVDEESQLTKKEWDLHFQGLWWDVFSRLGQEGFTCCLLILTLTDTLEVVRVVLRLTT